MSDKEPRPGNHDRAWNDPPLFSYSSQPDGESKDCLKLNKRVGFPTQGAAKDKTEGDDVIDKALKPAQLHDAGARPVGTDPPPPPPPSLSSSVKPVVAEVVKDEEPSASVEEVVKKLNAYLSSTSLEERKKQDIKKRIGMMEKKWLEGELNNDVQRGMAKIAQLLEDGDAKAAEKIQLTLIVDWPALCGTWIVGIKHLIANAKNQS